MKYTITQPVGEANELAFVTLEKSEGLSGFSVSIKPLIAEVVYGSEKIMHRYNALTIVTPYDYEVRIERIKRRSYRWFPDNPVKAVRWYTKQCAKFNLGRAAVEVDSRRRVLTIYVTSSAIIQKESD